MAEQKRRAKDARKRDGVGDEGERYAELTEQFGLTEFTGRDEYESKARVLAVLDESGDEVSIVLDRTPFYAESGGQVGDTGFIVSDTGRADVTNTLYGAPGLHRHVARVVSGEITPGQEVTAAIDGPRRDAIRRNHTATHLLHWALRQVLGDHVKQQGSLVAPDRLRFDFSHYEPMTPDEIRQVEDLVNTDVLGNFPARHYETTKDYAEQIGAIAFFGEKYGEIVRVLEAGPSTELCGGTHVHALGFIGPIKVVSESSIGSNIRRLEAMTGDGAFEYIEFEEQLLRRAGDLLRSSPKEVPDKIERLSEEVRALKDELRELRAKAAANAAGDLAGKAERGIVVERIDGLGSAELKQLAQETVRSLGRGVVALIGAADGKAAIAVAISKDLVAEGASADAIAKPAVAKLGGGVGRGADAVVGGGQNVAGIDDALSVARELAAQWGS
jgi:alanyl-tRNA synthetase